MTTIIRFIKQLLRQSRKQSSPVHTKHVIPRAQHDISKTDISMNALKVLNRLSSAGFEAFLVGGSVRDLLLRKAPKDFDVATNATPNQIKKLFRNARIIGRRFKLVHILFQREVIEVATFRGHEPIETQHRINERGMLIRDNVYGTLEEDAWRRDFTINSLYYNMNDGSIVDFTGGFKDIESRLIRIIGDPITRYKEDPVRMLRALRFSAKLNFELEQATAESLFSTNTLINHVSSSRLFDEMAKIYQCGNAEMVQGLLIKYGLFEKLFPLVHQLFESQYPVKALIGIALENTDTRIQDNKPITPAFLFAVLLWFPLMQCANQFRKEGLAPLPALEKAMSVVIAQQNQTISIPKRYTQIMREMWIMQYRFPRRAGKRAFNLLQHPRFRAAYDFLALRALAGDESIDLAQWWTIFQEESLEKQNAMVSALGAPSMKKRRRKPRFKS